jgi:valyl-tRNA synthetase
MIDKTYQPAEVEGRIYAAWEAAGAFRAGRPERAKAAPYCIVIPPPNVTGLLHMGHALNNTLQDVLSRFERMRGKDVLWQPGTDHAGIATQMVVERQLMERQQPGRRELGREKFLQRVWEWKAESGGTIVKQLKRLGASCDWSRERFTMDEGLSRAVLKVFVEFYKAGLIYKDKRLVNWDPKLLTAISDLEVQQIEHRGSFKWSRDEKDENGQPKPLNMAALAKILDRDPNGHLYYINYPLEGATFDPNDPSTFITVATTRPETMLGDVAIAVHPENEKLKHLIGKNAILPLVGRKIPIIGDDYADPEKGTGAVKITPAHDFNDFEVWQRHKENELKGIDPIRVFNGEAKISIRENYDFRHRVKNNPEMDRTIEELDKKDAKKIDRFIARKNIIDRLEISGFLEKIEPHTHMVPHGDRSGVVIEPFLTYQWYVDAKTLAQPAIKAVREGKTNFVPKNWEKTYFDWMENIQPWCISRQLWWGHQIPAWYGPSFENGKTTYNLTDTSNNQIFVATLEAEAINQARSLYKRNVVVVSSIYEAFNIDMKVDSTHEDVFIWRDEDVLDTWFSSALWPFSTLGWPDDTPELKRFYPTSALVTGFDIIFFWVARMMMMGLHFMKEVPFHTVYIHALVRDERGAKMSKSKGNVIDPLGIIDEYGADALRFTLAAMAAQGRDIKLSPQRVEGYRNFATKLWNAARFAEMNNASTVTSFNPNSVKETINRWILTSLSDAIGQIEMAIQDYRFNDAAGKIYQFVWNTYCDWYLELTKPLLQGDEGAAKIETRATIAHVRDEILKLLHPFMPFITEELWQVTVEVGTGRGGLLALAPWPVAGSYFGEEFGEINWLIDLISQIRSVRAEMNIAGANAIPLVVVGASEVIREWLEIHDASIKRLARVSTIQTANTVPEASVQIIISGAIACLPLKGVIDLAAERARLEKEMQKVATDIARVDAKLSNADFIARAPEEVVDGEREKREEAEGRKAKILEALERLKGAA